MNKKNYIKGFFLAGTGAAGWGISGVCSQYLFMEYSMSSEWLTAIRMVFSGVILLMISIVKEGRRPFGIWKNKKDLFHLMIFSLVGLLLCQYSFLGTIKHSNSATATVLQSLNVVFMAITVAVMHKTPMSKKQTISIFLAMAGTYLIATNGNPTSMKISTAALVLGLTAAATIVVYTLLSRSILPTWGNITVTGWGMLIGGSVIFIATKAWVVPDNLDMMALLMIAAIILIGTAIGFSIFLESVKYIGPVKATIVGCLEPASATILSALFLGTRFTAVELIGFALIILTVFLSAASDDK